MSILIDQVQFSERKMEFFFLKLILKAAEQEAIQFYKNTPSSTNFFGGFVFFF